MSVVSHNPFATQFTRPGAIPYICSDQWDLNRLVERLEANRWRGQIVGPHGTGKSTLVASLLPLFRRASRDVILVQVTSQQRRPGPLAPHGWSAASLVIVDGFGELPIWWRWWLRWRVQRRRVGLLITAHRSFGLPLLMETRVTPVQAVQIANRLLADVPGPHNTVESLVIERLTRHQGNMREALFDLYDWYQSAHGRS